MPTGKIVLRTTEEFMSDYTPVYTPIYSIFLGGKARQYDAEVGAVNFKRAEAIGDIRANRMTPKDTEIKQINVTDALKAYKKYFFANQYIISDLQDQEGAEDVVAQVLDEHHVQADELLMLGDGTAPGNVINNGLYYSGDSNYLLEASIEIPLTDRLSALHTAVVASATKANQVAGRKVVFFYGDAVAALVGSIYTQSSRSFKTVLQEVLGPNYTIVVLPTASVPAGASGWIIANLDQVTLHYSVLPQLFRQGQNEEHMYYWFNFLMGSMMLEVQVKNGIIRQPITFAV